MKKLGLQGAKANQLSKALKQEAFKEMIRARKTALNNLEERMTELYKQKKIDIYTLRLNILHIVKI